MVAFEMAAQLAADGEDIGLLATFNGPTPRYLKAHGLDERDDFAALGIKHGARRQAGRLRAALSFALGWHMESGRRREAFRDICAHAARTYRPNAFSGTMLVVTGAGLFGDPFIGWQACAARVETLEVPGVHQHTLDAVYEPHVEYVSRRLEETIARSSPLAVP